MQSPTDEELPQIDSQQTCGRPDCICALPIGERFILWALRQWQCELFGWREGRTLPPEGSALLRGFGMAGLSTPCPTSRASWMCCCSARGARSRSTRPRAPVWAAMKRP